jgi:threonyl-tRNA synthetase
LDDNDINYKAFPGEGAFYGPKVDFFVPDALGREWQLGTIQLDFSLPERFDLEYVNEEGQRSRPVMIHRAMLGSLERFMGVIIEHFAGAMPPWLSPSQVIIIPIADRHVEKAQELKSKLIKEKIRVEIDSRNERMNSKIREAQMNKIPYMVILGDKEIESEVVSIRLRTGENLQSIPIEDFISSVKKNIDNRMVELWQ